MVSPIEPPSLPAVGGTPALSRVRRGGRRKQGNPRQRPQVESEDDETEGGDQPRKGRHIDERA